MNILDRTIGVFSPGWALKRAQARKVLRTYQGAEANRLTNHKKPKNQSADQELLGPYGADAARAWARALVRDNAYAWNVVDTIVSNIIGSGITAQSIYETPEGEDVEDVNDMRDKLFTEWCELADINGQLTFEEIQVLAQREIVEAGEVLIRFIRTPGKTYKGITRPVPLALEMIEADRLALEKDTYASRTSKGGADGNRIIRGVEVDEKGKPVAYWLYPDHPNTVYAVSRTPERILADEILHLFRRDRVGQTRGVTWFAPIMSWLRDLGVYVDNEIQASAVASCFGVAIKTETPIAGLSAPVNEDTTDTNGNPLDYLEPAMVTYLRPGESIESINPGRPNSASEPWINLMLRGISAGTGTNYEAIAKDFSKTSYSSSRSSKIEDRPRYKRGQSYIVNHLCLPVWDEFCNAAARVDAKGFPTSTELLEDRRGFAPVEWQLPEQQWVDPNSEQKAAESSIVSFTNTRQNVLGSRGLSWRAVLYQAAKEQRLMKKLGLITQEQLDAGVVAEPAAQAQPTGEYMGLSRLQQQRNRKGIDDAIAKAQSGEWTRERAEADLQMLGLAQETIDKVLVDVADGTLDNPEVLNVA